LTILPPSKPIYTKSAKEAEMMSIDKEVTSLLNEIEYYYDVEEDFYDVKTLTEINEMEDGKLDIQLDIKVNDFDNFSVVSKIDFVLKTLPILASVEIPDETEYYYKLKDLQQMPKGIYLEFPSEEELKLEISKLKSENEAIILKILQIIEQRAITLQRNIDKVTEAHDLKYRIVMQHNWYPEIKALKARYNLIRPYSKNNNVQSKEDIVLKFHDAIEKLSTRTIHASHNNKNSSLVSWKLCNKINGCLGKVPVEDIEWANALMVSSGCLTEKAKLRWNFTSTKESQEQCFTGLMYITRNLQ
jgi:hypothetical protein